MTIRRPALAPWILLCSCTADPAVLCVGSVSGLDCGERATPAPSSCGNGTLDVGEICDTAAVDGSAACPSTCDDGNACTTDRLVSSGTCAAVCRRDPVLACAGDDGCCPPGCNSLADGDCLPACGDGALDDGEVCDPLIPAGVAGACPTACDDGDACTVDDLAGAGTCWPECSASPVVACADADGCCPSGCDFAVDSDCVPPPEICNGADDDGDTFVDEGCDDDVDGFCDATMGLAGSPAVCALGGGDCDDASAAVSPGAGETCDGRDENCDGRIDEGNPGGGAACEAASVGACAAVMTCVAGELSCRGGFVSPLGAPGNPGTLAAPVSSIGEAIANAAAGASGADVCVCAPAGSGTTDYQEPVTMVEGVSVIGNYDCDTWQRNPSRPTTRILNTRTDGVRFPAGLTRDTALDGFLVEPLVIDGGTSVAVRVTDASPSLLDVHVDWPSAAPMPRSGIGLQVVSAARAAAPWVLGGEYSGPGAATQASIGVDCQGCAGASLAADRVSSGTAPTSVGIRVRGAADGLTLLAGGSPFWDVDGPLGGAGAVGVWLDACVGSPEIGAGTGLRIRGGVDSQSGIGVRATGSSCAPFITGDGPEGSNSIVGCGFEFGAGACVGVSCEKGAPCQILDSVVVGASFLFGKTTGHLETAIGVRCLEGGCTYLAHNDIRAGDVTVTASSAGVEVDGSSPLVDGNLVLGNDGDTCPAGACAAVRLNESASRLTNNVIGQGLASGVALDILGDAPGPEVNSNALQPNCRPGGNGVGIRIEEGLAPGPLPIIRNNIVAPQPGACSNLYGVHEVGPAADPAAFQNNDLWGMAGGLYINEGAGALTTEAQVNALPESSANLSCDPVLDGTGHIGSASCCVDKGSAAGAPEVDRDGQIRPMGVAFDVGPDEVTP